MINHLQTEMLANDTKLHQAVYMLTESHVELLEAINMWIFLVKIMGLVHEIRSRCGLTLVWS